MNDKDPDLLGRLSALESFLISPGNQYGIIGDMLEGEVRPGAYAHIQLNSMLTCTARIDEVKEIQFSGDESPHKLLFFNESKEGYNDILLAMNVGIEIIDVRISGED